MFTGVSHTYTSSIFRVQDVWKKKLFYPEDGSNYVLPKHNIQLSDYTISQSSRQQFSFSFVFFIFRYLLNVSVQLANKRGFQKKNLFFNVI
jgi:hypothetical protein